MNEVKNPQVKQKIVLGDFSLYIYIGKNNAVWIKHSSGEGGEFSMESLEQVIQEFFDRNM